jgi:hypothetical protein
MLDLTYLIKTSRLSGAIQSPACTAPKHNRVHVGVLKRCFKVLTAAQEYPLKNQAHLVSALAVVHNFIRIHDPNDIPLAEDEEDQQANG